MRSFDDSFGDRCLGVMQTGLEEFLMARRSKPRKRKEPIILDDLEIGVPAAKDVEEAILEPEVIIDAKPATVAQLKVLIEAARVKVVVEFEKREKKLTTKLEAAEQQTKEAIKDRDKARGLAANARKRLSVISQQLKQERRGRIGIRKPLVVKKGVS